MNDTGTFTGMALALAGVVIYGLCIVTGACNVSDADSLRTLQHEGVTDAQLQGYAWFACSSSDSFSTAFHGVKNGSPIDGYLCAGWFKGITVRYK